MSFSMDNLLNAPISLSCAVLNNWLIIRGIAKLDSACCNSALRPIFLRMLSSRQFMQRKSINLITKKEFAWIVKRDIRLYAITIDARLLESEEIFNYFELQGKEVRKVVFDYGAFGDLFLVAMHCRNLVSVSFCPTTAGHVIRDVLSNNPSLEEVVFEAAMIEPYMLRNITLPRLKTLYYTGTEQEGIQKGLCQQLSLLNDGVTRLCLSRLDFPTPDSILLFTMRFTDLRTLDLSHTNVNGLVITSVVETCPRIVNLKLCGCEMMSDEGILVIAQNLQELRTLDIRGCVALTDNSLAHLTEYSAAHLVALYVDLTNLSVVDTSALLEKCTRLHTFGLELSDSYGLCADDDLHDMFKALSHVQQLQLRGAGLMTNDVIVLIGRYCHKVIHLELRTIEEPENEEEEQDAYITATGFFALKVGCKQLRRLIVYEECSLLQNELAMLMWQEARPGLTITSSESLDFNSMAYDV